MPKRPSHRPGRHCARHCTNLEHIILPLCIQYRGCGQRWSGMVGPPLHQLALVTWDKLEQPSGAQLAQDWRSTKVTLSQCYKSPPELHCIFFGHSPGSGLLTLWSKLPDSAHPSEYFFLILIYLFFTLLWSSDMIKLSKKWFLCSQMFTDYKGREKKFTPGFLKYKAI